MRRVWIVYFAFASVLSAQQAQRIWTIQELFTRNVGSTEQQNKQFPPHKIIGNVTLTAHHTPGHTPGCTTWTMKVQDGGRSYDVLIIGSVGVNPGTNLVGNPQLVAQYQQSLKFLRAAHVDVPLGSHPAMYSMMEKYAKVAAGGPNPFIDPAGFAGEVTIQESAFQNELKRQQVEGPPPPRGGGARRGQN